MVCMTGEFTPHMNTFEHYFLFNIRYNISNSTIQHWFTSYMYAHLVSTICTPTKGINCCTCIYISTLL